jgi:hypothetical protein
MNDVTATILEILASAESATPNIAPTVLYNEGWLLRLGLHTAARDVDCLPFRFARRSRWFSEALLHSAFCHAAVAILRARAELMLMESSDSSISIRPNQARFSMQTPINSSCVKQRFSAV